MTDHTRMLDPVSDQDARFAIEGAIEWGRQGIKPPPDDHWLAPFWNMGKRLASLPALLDEVEALRQSITRAEQLINHAVQIMTDEQVGQWTGVRHWLEIDADFNAKPSGELEALRKDAERYRWLRDEAEHFSYPAPWKETVWPVIGINHTDCHPVSHEELDAAIDAAREGK